MTPRKTARSFPRALAIALLATLLAACATIPTPTVRRDGADNPAGATAAGQTAAGQAVRSEPLATGGADADDVPRPVIRRGTGQVLNRAAAAAPPPSIAASSGEASFNFEGESLHAVVKAILGDMLEQNFTIAPGVQGTVTLNVQKVSASEAFTLLEQVLSWNNARMVYVNGVYNVVPSDQALAGTVAPGIGPPGNTRGYEVRAVPLRYISATEMKKALEPYARPNAIVNVDSGRNVITIAGSRAELENYLRTIQIFDVDWMSTMSVGVFPLRSGKASKVVGDLERVFGAQSNSPVAGMFRFMPLEGANAVLVITPQPDYLDDIQQWLDRIDGAGAGVQLFSYELKYIKAKDLADRLAEVFGGSRAGGQGGQDGSASLMPGTQSTEIRDGGLDGNGISSAPVGGKETGGYGGDTGTTGGGLGDGTLSLNQQQSGNGSVTLEVEGERVGVSAVEETNTLLVRTTSTAWKSIRDVVERLDVMPMQVHIEAQVVEVTLTGQLEYGIDWFFENAVNAPTTQGGAGLPSALGRGIWGDIAGSIRRGTETGGGGLAWTFLGRNAAAIVSALDEVTDLKVLQSPSVFVRNNKVAYLNVGSRIPITSVSINPNGNNDNTFSQVQYLDTGTILTVRPRVTKDGMVFLDLVQEVSSPGARNQADINGNVPIDTRKLKTEAAVQSGDTVMMAGLIRDEAERGSSGIPGLSRIPVIGGLFGRQTSRKGRSEVIILITPTIVRNPQEARDLTDEYGRRFRALEPLHRAPKQD